MERSAGQGGVPDAGSVGAKTETVGPAVEGRFDWEQAGMTEEEYMDVAQSAGAMYDIGSEAENIRAYLRDQPLRQKIQSGEMPTQLEMGQFRKHIPGTNEYKQYVEKMRKKGWYGPSRLNVDVHTAQSLVDRYRGTGILEYTDTGEWKHTEIITINITTVGMVVNNLTGTEAATKAFKIHYGRQGTHIVPTYPSREGAKAKR